MSWPSTDFEVELQMELDELRLLRDRVNFVINTSKQHTQPCPEWVLKTLRGLNPQCEGKKE